MLLLLGVYALGLIGFVGQLMLFGGLGQRILHRIRGQIFAKTARLPLGFYDRVGSGDLMSRLVNDVDVVAGFLSQGLIQSSAAMVGLLFVLAVMFASSPLLAAVTSLSLPLTWWITWWFAQRARVRYRTAREAIGEVSSNLQEDLAGVREAQAFARTERNVEAFAEANRANRDANVNAVAVTSAFTPRDQPARRAGHGRRGRARRRARVARGARGGRGRGLRDLGGQPLSPATAALHLLDPGPGGPRRRRAHLRAAGRAGGAKATPATRSSWMLWRDASPSMP